MTDQVADTVEQPSYLGMSDAEIMNATGPVVNTAPVTENPETPSENPGEVADPEASEAPTDDAGTAAEEGLEEDEEGDEQGERKPFEGNDSPDKDAEKVEKPNSIDFEAEYKRLLAPFKANGREIAVNSVEDAIALMQMGANYNKKMAALKPNLKLMKLLENNGLLDEGKIGYLIDLDKKSPEAINKLVKDSGLDPMDFDAEKAGEYKPKIHAVDDREIELDTVLDEIQDTPSYARTLSIVSKEWDGASKQVVAGSPQLLKVINDHVERGIYDRIIKEVESERVFGRLNGMSDIEAYRQVGDAIQARGGFNDLGSSQAKSSRQAVIVPPKPKKVENDALNEKRRAAGSTKPAVPSTIPKDFNPLALSDEEFNKLSVSRFR